MVCISTENAAIKNEENLWYAETWTELEGMVLSEVGKTQKAVTCSWTQKVGVKNVNLNTDNWVLKVRIEQNWAWMLDAQTEAAYLNPLIVVINTFANQK